MNSKVLIKDYASLMEFRLGGYNSTNLIHQADIIVNPTFSSPMRKKILINLPVEVPISRLSKFNKIVSRFPINGVELEEYKLPRNRTEIHKEDYSLLILNKYMLTDLSRANLIDNTNFLLGVDAVIDDSITAVGYLLLRTKLENLF